MNRRTILLALFFLAIVVAATSGLVHRKLLGTTGGGCSGPDDISPCTTIDGCPGACSAGICMQTVHCAGGCIVTGTQCAYGGSPPNCYAASGTACTTPDGKAGTCAAGACTASSNPCGSPPLYQSCTDEVNNPGIGQVCGRTYCCNGTTLVDAGSCSVGTCMNGTCQQVSSSSAASVASSTTTSSPQCVPADCTDNNDCTTDACSAGVCSHINNSNACAPDALSCTDDICAGGACTHPNKPKDTACTIGGDPGKCSGSTCVNKCAAGTIPATISCETVNKPQDAGATCGDPEECCDGTTLTTATRTCKTSLSCKKGEDGSKRCACTPPSGVSCCEDVCPDCDTEEGRAEFSYRKPGETCNFVRCVFCESGDGITACTSGISANCAACDPRNTDPKCACTQEDSKSCGPRGFYEGDYACEISADPNGADAVCRASHGAGTYGDDGGGIAALGGNGGGIGGIGGTSSVGTIGGGIGGTIGGPIGGTTGGISVGSNGSTKSSSKSSSSSSSKSSSSSGGSNGSNGSAGSQNSGASGNSSNANSASNQSNSNANSASNSNSVSNSNSASNYSNSSSVSNSNSISNSNSASNSVSNSNSASNSNSISNSNVSSSKKSSSSSSSSSGTGTSLSSAGSNGTFSSGVSGFSSSSALSLYFSSQSSGFSSRFFSSTGFCCVTVDGERSCLAGLCSDPYPQCYSKCTAWSSSSFFRSGASSSASSEGYCCVAVRGKPACLIGLCSDSLLQCSAKCVESHSSMMFVIASSSSSSSSSFFSATSCVTDNECGDGSCHNGLCTSRVYVAAAPLCGNGLLESPEECDDTNRRDNDGCNASCLLEIGLCGDGIVETLLGEQCESSTFDKSLPYSCVHCRFASNTCGDGTTDPGEECDEGDKNSTSPDAHCRPDCSISRCGDGIRDTGEQCDDNNRMSGDGCDVTCTMENGTASSAPLVAAVTMQQNIAFPQFPGFTSQLPLAQLQPIMQNAPQTAQSGPAALMAIAAGAGTGVAWVRKRRKK